MQDFSDFQFEKPCILFLSLDNYATLYAGLLHNVPVNTEKFVM